MPVCSSVAYASFKGPRCLNQKMMPMFWVARGWGWGVPADTHTHVTQLSVQRHRGRMHAACHTSELWPTVFSTVRKIRYVTDDPAAEEAGMALFCWARQDGR
jgi:hypothetical protein